MPSFAEGFMIGSIEAENRGLNQAIDSWINYAKKLENQNKNLRKEADYYRVEAMSGWTAWKAAEKIARKKLGYPIGDDPDFEDIRDEFEDAMYEAVDKSMEAYVYGKKK